VLAAIHGLPNGTVTALAANASAAALNYGVHERKMGSLLCMTGVLLAISIA
jgi:hypothetical protein